MTFSRKIPAKFWIIFSACIIICLISLTRAFENYELISYDLRLKIRPALKQSKEIIIIQISDDTLKNLGKWPLPRDFHASLVDVLREFGAERIVFDIVFAEPTVNDEVFSRSIKAAGNVVLPLAFYLEDNPSRVFTEGSAILADTVSTLSQNASGIGHVNVFVDPDGKTRAVPLFIKYNQALYPQLGFKAACDLLGLNCNNVLFKHGKAIIDNRLSLPLAHDGSFLVNYPDKWEKSFHHLSYFEVLKSYGQIKKGTKPDIDLSLLKDKVCFVGLTATGTSDLRPTPLENIYPMLGLQASVFNSIINRSFILDAGLFSNTMINLLIFILSLLICLRLTPLRTFAGCIILGIAYFIISLGLFIFLGVWVDLFLPLSIIILVYIGATLYRIFAETKKRELLEKELDIARTIQESFLPEEIKEFSGLGLAAFLKPAKFVAGDLYDIIKLSADKIGILIGDVSGKGVPASLIMAQTISLFRIFSRQYQDCPRVLESLNRELCGKFGGRFVTCLYMVVDTKDEKVKVSSAGQAPLILHRKETNNVLEVDLLQELPLGLSEDVKYKEVEFNLGKGDKIILFTDGLSEARNRDGQEFGLKNIKNIILEKAQGSAQELLEAMKEEVFRFSNRAPQHDDITLIVISGK